MCIYSVTVPYVYKWTHIPTGKWYIGSKIKQGWNPSRHEEYICSSEVVKPLVLANRDEWTYEILSVGDREYIKQLEILLLCEVDARNNPQSFNQHNGDGIYSRTGTTHTEQTKLKMRQSHLNQIPWNKGKKHSPDHIEKVASKLRGVSTGPRSEEMKAKQSAKMKGRAPWNKGKIGVQPAWNKGKPTSPEIIAKRVASRLGNKKTNLSNED